MMLNNNTGMPNEQQTFGGYNAQSTKKKGFSFNLQKNWPILVVILLVVFAGASIALGALYLDLKEENEELKQAGTTEEYNLIKGNLEKLVTIGSDEQVNIAKIDNPDELKTQDAEFYKDVKLGQYLVVMPNTQRVLIYDQETNKIVNFSSYSIKVDIIPEEEIPATEKPLNIEIRSVASVTDETITGIENALAEKSTNYKVTAKTKTNSTNVKKGISLVLLNRTNKPKMSQNIIGHVGTSSLLEAMPEGEAASSADVVILIGEVQASE